MIYVVAGWISLAFVGASPGAWPQFRGPAGDGVVAEPAFPMTWSETENVAWKTPIPGSGWSQPVVVGDRVYVSYAESADGSKPKKMGEGSVDPRSMLPVAGKPPQVVYKWGFVCLNLATGEILWRRDATEQMPSIPAHPSNTYATETPATDGKQVYLQFGSIGKFFAFDLDGNLQWEVDLGLQTMAAGFGTGSSPIVHDGKVIVQCYNADNAVLRALDPSSGKDVWRAERKKGSSWSTPFLWRTKDRVELIACGDSRVFFLTTRRRVKPCGKSAESRRRSRPVRWGMPTRSSSATTARSAPRPSFLSSPGRRGTSPSPRERNRTSS